jgi:hypothetical protein
MLSAGAKPKVLTGGDKISWLYFGSEGRVGIFQDVLCQLREIASEMSKAAGYDVVGGNAIAKFEDPSF